MAADLTPHDRAWLLSGEHAPTSVAARLLDAPVLGRSKVQHAVGRDLLLHLATSTEVGHSPLAALSTPDPAWDPPTSIAAHTLSSELRSGASLTSALVSHPELFPPNAGKLLAAYQRAFPLSTALRRTVQDLDARPSQIASARRSLLSTWVPATGTSAASALATAPLGPVVPPSWAWVTYVPMAVAVLMTLATASGWVLLASSLREVPGPWARFDRAPYAPGYHLLAVLLEAGVVPAAALELVAETLTVTAARRRFSRAAQRCASGEPLAHAMERAGLTVDRLHAATDTPSKVRTLSAASAASAASAPSVRLAPPWLGASAAWVTTIATAWLAAQ